MTAFIFEWFHARRGLAGGLVWACTGIGGSVLPFAVNGLLDVVRYRDAMICLGLLYGTVSAIAVIPIERRVPLALRQNGESNQVGRRQSGRTDWTFLRTRADARRFGLGPSHGYGDVHTYPMDPVSVEPGVIENELNMVVSLRERPGGDHAGWHRSDLHHEWCVRSFFPTRKDSERSQPHRSLARYYWAT